MIGQNIVETQYLQGAVNPVKKSVRVPKKIGGMCCKKKSLCSNDNSCKKYLM